MDGHVALFRCLLDGGDGSSSIGGGGRRRLALLLLEGASDGGHLELSRYQVVAHPEMKCYYIITVTTAQQTLIHTFSLVAFFSLSSLAEIQKKRKEEPRKRPQNPQHPSLCLHDDHQTMSTPTHNCYISQGELFISLY